MKEITTEKLLSIIKSYRQELGYSQAEMAKKSGISTSFYGMLERGCRSLTIDYLIKIAKALDCTATDLLEIAEAEK